MEKFLGTAKICVESRSSEEFELGDQAGKGIKSRGSQWGLHFSQVLKIESAIRRSKWNSRFLGYLVTGAYHVGG